MLEIERSTSSSRSIVPSSSSSSEICSAIPPPAASGKSALTVDSKPPAVVNALIPSRMNTITSNKRHISEKSVAARRPSESPCLSSTFADNSVAKLSSASLNCGNVNSPVLSRSALVKSRYTTTRVSLLGYTRYLKAISNSLKLISPAPSRSNASNSFSADSSPCMPPTGSTGKRTMWSSPRSPALCIAPTNAKTRPIVFVLKTPSLTAVRRPPSQSPVDRATSPEIVALVTVASVALPPESARKFPSLAKPFWRRDMFLSSTASIPSIKLPFKPRS
mmetsp:Transcript_16592/g.43061  ORF Transcript_16592/g.43061 Transcript_16592/m.43061 type:complete len:277 (+) Transcript_16592:121-951(+)